MNLEIERKYLLKALPDKDPIETIQIVQWYLKVDDIWERVRSCISDKNGAYFLHTIKTFVSDGVQIEDEKEIGQLEFNDFVIRCHTKGNKSRKISKVRHIITHTDDGLYWEIDEFKDNVQLVVAEIEIPSDDYKVELPKFIKNKLILDVTGFKEFSNRYLSNKIKL